MEDNAQDLGAQSPKTKKEKGKNGGLIWIITIAAFVFLFGFLTGFKMWIKETKKMESQIATQTELANEASKNLAEAKNTISLLQGDIADLNNQIVALKARPATVVRGSGSDAAKDKHIASLERALTQCMSSKGNAMAPLSNELEKNTNTVPEPAFQANVAAKKTSVAATGLPEQYYEDDKTVPMCIRLGGNSNRHLPHIGMREFDFADARSNGIGGFNWYLKGTTADLVGDYGCTNDGTFFISAKLIEKYLIKSDGGKVELIAKAFDWVPKQMEKFGDYYICSGK